VPSIFGGEQRPAEGCRITREGRVPAHEVVPKLRMNKVSDLADEVVGRDGEFGPATHDVSDTRVRARRQQLTSVVRGRSFKVVDKFLDSRPDIGDPDVLLHGVNEVVAARRGRQRANRDVWSREIPALEDLN